MSVSEEDTKPLDGRWFPVPDVHAVFIRNARWVRASEPLPREKTDTVHGESFAAAGSLAERISAFGVKLVDTSEETNAVIVSSPDAPNDASAKVQQNVTNSQPELANSTLQSFFWRPSSDVSGR